MKFLIVAAFSLLIIILGVYHVSRRTRIHATVGAVHALPAPRSTGDAADTPILAHSSDVLDFSASIDAQEQVERWKRLAEGAEKCIEMFLPRRDVDFISFIQNATLCNILAAFYNVDPGTLSPLDVASTINALNGGSDRCRRKCIDRLVRGAALEIILPAYESMWPLFAVTLAQATSEHMRNAFLDFSENPTKKQFCAFKCKDTEASVEAYIKEVMRLNLHMCLMQQSRHPWWKRVFYSAAEMDDIQPELSTFDAMRFHPKRLEDQTALSFGIGGLWALIATALIVAKAIDKVDDVRFILTRNASDTNAGRDTSIWSDGLVIKRKEKADPYTYSPPPPPYPS
ncbi:hypothetical protein K503DRAFT_772233 [Rhizopogon vinicolor AM-OR11-026]|uniref:Uncharacterized protein n=1 Tax=Rhizopogon vinicolor AM-OR11-026 TaxID=1314800 RepID=A0A1B7MW01_9AGAM|nr:hypothetical protein K503DRAFT_772233 [Rhizopogon vinicolor AM-OR11-026]